MNFRITALFSLLMLPTFVLSQESVSPLYPPILHLSTEQDHPRLMDLPGTKTIRHGREGDLSSAFTAN
jgi:hypothetical protein